jgi:hypothetical protein
MGHVNKVSHVFTLSHVAEMLGEDEEWLFEVAEEMDTEDGQLWVVGVGEDGVMAFTDDGIENLKELIAIHNDTPSIIEKTTPSARCDDEAEDRRVRRDLTANRIDQQISALAAYSAWLLSFRRSSRWFVLSHPLRKVPTAINGG